MTMRLGGIASGWDTESIISTLIDAERIPAVRLESENELLSYKYRGWNDLDTAVSTLQSSAQDLISYSTWTQMRATPADSTVLTASATSKAATGVYSFANVDLAKSHRIASAAQADTTTALGYDGTFTLGGQEVTVAADATLADVRDAINTAMASASDSDKVVATIIDTTLVLERKQTGSTNISITDDSSNILTSLGVVTDSTTLAVANQLQAGEAFTATVNGIAVARETNIGLDDIITGVTLNFLDEDDTTLDVGRDTDTIRSLIDDFIENYNAAMSRAGEYGKVELTDSKSVADQEVDDVGLLQGELLLSQLQSRSRSLITARDETGNLDEAFNTLRKIGIWTDGRENKLAIVDQEALDNALTNHLDEVEDLFRSYDGGIMRNFFNYMDSMISPLGGSITNRKKSIQDAIASNEKDIKNIDTRLADMETMLWEKYARMESIMAGTNSQVSMIMSALGQGQSK